MDDDQQFCLRWNNHQSTLISVFDTLLENETLVDCTLAAEGKFLKAHKVVLSACSPYFATLLQEQYDKHPIFILKDVKYQELRAMMDYMYRGEVNISQDQLAALLKAAESLQIKGLSDNRSGGGTTAPKPEHHRATMPTGKLSAGYTLEQTKRARIAGPAEPEMGSREGSSSPSRRRRKVRRRSIENAMTDVHDNSNSSQQQTQSNASGLGAITAAASALAAAAAAAPNTQSLASNVPLSASTSSSTAVTAPGTTLSSSKKTDIVKGTTQQQQQQQQTQQDAMNTDNVQGPASAATATGSIDTETTDNAAAVASTATDKSNHKQLQQQLKQAKESISGNAAAAGSASELVIEPKAEYDDEANDEPVEDLTLDEEDMGMDDLDQNAGTSQGGEGSSQGYAPWQHDRSQDELLLATQEAQQRDPQDLTHKFAQIHKENTAPNQVQKIKKTNTRSILNTNNTKRSNSRNSIGESANGPNIANVKNKRMSMSDVSDMLYEFYRANAAAKAPKGLGPQQPQVVMGSGATAAAVKYVGQTSPTSAETNEPSSIAAIATNGAASETASKNLQSDEMMSNKLAASFHPRIMYNNTNTKVPSAETANECNMPSLTAIPTSVVVPPTNLAINAEPLDIKPIINPATGLVMTPNPSVIKPVPVNTSANPQAAAIAAALIRDGYHSFQQQMRAQELIKFHTGKINKNVKVEDSSTTKILENFLRQQRNSECDNETGSDYNDGDDEDDSRYNGFDDIHLMEGSKAQFPQLLHNVMTNNSTAGTPAPGDYFSDESQKYMSLAAQAQAQAYRNLEYSLSDFGNTSPNDSANMGPTGIGPDGEPVYECRHCGKKYRWKSTLRRHENVECGGKEPSHQCPYCPYKSKQRGNLGVHVRKHHSNLPQLASKRRSKYSIKCESNPSSANVSDDSNSKLIIDCSK